VEWLGIRAFKAEQIWAIQSLKPEDILDMEKVQEITEAVHRLYTSSGFPNVSVAPEVNTLGHNSAGVVFRVQEDSRTATQ
jgi:outer membrane protein assembly factor BamA